MPEPEVAVANKFTVWSDDGEAVCPNIESAVAILHKMLITNPACCPAIYPWEPSDDAVTNELITDREEEEERAREDAEMDAAIDYDGEEEGE